VTLPLPEPPLRLDHQHDNGRFSIKIGRRRPRAAALRRRSGAGGSRGRSRPRGARSGLLHESRRPGLARADEARLDLQTVPPPPGNRVCRLEHPSRPARLLLAHAGAEREAGPGNAPARNSAPPPPPSSAHQLAGRCGARAASRVGRRRSGTSARYPGGERFPTRAHHRTERDHRPRARARFPWRADRAACDPAGDRRRATIATCAVRETTAIAGPKLLEVGPGKSVFARARAGSPARTE